MLTFSTLAQGRTSLLLPEQWWYVLPEGELVTPERGAYTTEGFPFHTRIINK